MKKLLPFLLLLTFFTAAQNAFSQVCTPSLPPDGSHSHIVPDTIINLPHATVGEVYASDIQIYVGTDTTVTVPITLNLTIVNFTVDSITGLPTGFDYDTNPASGIFPGGSSACVHAFGAAPTPGMEGTYPLLIYVTANLSSILGPVVQHPIFTGYKAVIDPAGTVGIEGSLNADKFEIAQNIPNPSTGVTRINFSSPVNEKIELNIYNSIGQVVFNKTIDAERGNNEVSVSTAEFADGIYIYTLRNSSTTLSKRMLVTKK